MSTGYGEENIYEKYGQPTLDLVFTGPKKSLTDRVGNVAVEFTRTSTATYVGSDGLIKTAAVDEARFDHDSAGNSLGLLIEESRTNLSLRSQQLGFAAGNWFTNAATCTDNQGLAPDGTITAARLVPNTADTIHYVGDGTGASLSGTATISVFAKADGYNFIFLAFDYSSGGGSFPGSAYFDLSTGQINLGASTTGSIQQFPNGWYRCSITATAGSTTQANPLVAASNSFSNYFFVGDGSSGILLWGFQFEVGSFPTSYIPTTSSTATRSADVASMTGTNFSGWYNQSQGTLFQSCISRTPTGGPGGADAGIGAWLAGGANLRIGFMRPAPTTGLSAQVYNLSNFSADFLFESQWPQNSISKAALAYKENDFAASANGLQTQTDTSGMVPALTKLDIGQMSDATYNRIGAGTFARITYWPTRLPDSDLQSLTE